jgi:uncharacterized protein (DUF1330 family)
MSAYLIADITEISDQATYLRYQSQTSPGLVAANATYLARGGTIDILEGDWAPRRLVLVRFGSRKAVRDWWESPAYADLKRMRQQSAKTNMIVIDGAEDGRP